MSLSCGEYVRQTEDLFRTCFGRVKGEGRWEPAALGKALRPELGKVTKETTNDVFASGL